MMRFGPALLAGLVLAACQPTVRVEAPKDPIVINLNVNIQQEVRVKVDRALEDMLSKNEAIF
ncbi:MAG: YnbE family lipoprotein [Alphaproteobacteria bacterium]